MACLVVGVCSCCGYCLSSLLCVCPLFVVRCLLVCVVVVVRCLLSFVGVGYCCCCLGLPFVVI